MTTSTSPLASPSSTSFCSLAELKRLIAFTVTGKAA